MKQSLHTEVLKLTLSYEPKAVERRAWEMVLQQTGKRINRCRQTVPCVAAPGAGICLSIAPC